MICCLPFSGSFLGGYASKAVGGYANKHSLVVVIIFNLVACLLLSPMPFMNEWYGFLACCAAFQLGGSAVLPTLNGIILSSIPTQLKAKGYAIANVASILVGSVPAPTIYGLLNDKYKNIDKRFCMKAFTCYSFVGLFWMLIALIFRYRVDDKGSKKEPFKNDSKEEPHFKVAIMTGENHDLDVQMEINKDPEEDEESGMELKEKI